MTRNSNESGEIYHKVAEGDLKNCETWVGDNRERENMPKIIQKLEKRLGEAKELLPELAPEIKRQLWMMIEAINALDQKIYNEKKSVEKEKKLAMVYFKLTQFFYSREKRIEEMDSDEAKEAERIMAELMLLGIPYLAICMDGRIGPPVVAGLNRRAMKTPGGDIRDVVISRKTGLPTLKKHSKFAKMVDRILAEGNTLVEVLDSHIGCGAGGETIKQERGLEELPADGGLLRDVLRKKELVIAIRNYVKDKYKDRKRTAFVHISYDPHNGYLYMGLEKDECLAKYEDTDDGYSPEAISELVAGGQIISAKEMVEGEDNGLRSAFANNYFEINYEKKYKESIKTFWKNIRKFIQEGGQSSGDGRPNPFIVIIEKLKKVFPELQKAENQNELTERAVLLLANAYGAYLRNHRKDGSKKPFAHGRHQESVIVVSGEDRGPFDRAKGFSIDPSDPDLASAIVLGRSIVQKVRRQAIKDRTVLSEFENWALDALGVDRRKYVNYPIPKIHFEKLSKMPGKTTTERLKTIDWNSVLGGMDWMSMTSDEFYRRMDDLELSSRVVRGINDLRKNAIAMHVAQTNAASALLDGRSAGIWVLAGPNRETIAILPFISKGVPTE